MNRLWTEWNLLSHKKHSHWIKFVLLLNFVTNVSFTANTHTHTHVTMHQSQLLSGCKLLWSGCYNLHFKVRVEERTKALIFLRWLEITLTSLGLAWFRVSVHSQIWRTVGTIFQASLAAFALAQCWSTWRFPLASHLHLHTLKAKIDTLAKWFRESVTTDSGRKGPYSARDCLCEQLTSAASIHQTMEVFPCSKNKKKGDNKWPFTITNCFAIITDLYVGVTLLQ